jgi:uncharacterized protein YndB with AHSA1/START domain
VTDIVRVVRDIAAPPEAVFEAWTDPASLRIWMAPDPATVGAAECDARIGGAFRIVMIDASGSIEHTGTYEEVTRPSRLVFTWRASHLGNSVTRVIVSLTPTQGGTRMVIEHHGLPDGMAPAHRLGWTSIAANLDAVIAAAR